MIGLALPFKRLLGTVGVRRSRSVGAWRSAGSRGGSLSAAQSSPGWEAVLPPGKLESYKACKPERNERMTRVLQGLACSTAEVLGDASSGVRAIRLGNNAAFLPWMHAGDTIYERQFYPRLVDVLRTSSRRVILLNNSGTGKSVFQFYMLARFLNPALFAGDGGQGLTPCDEWDFGVAMPPKVVVRQVLGSSIQVWFLEQQVVHEVSTTNPIEEVLCCFDPATMLYFFEPGNVRGVEPCANDNDFSLSTFATVCTEKSRFNQFKKVATRKYMPVFTENELLAIGRDMRTRPDFDADLKDLYTDDAIRGRFATYNGIIPHVLPQTAETLTDLDDDRASPLISTIINAMPFLTGDLIDQTLSPYVAMYKVDESDFSRAGLTVVSAEVREDVIKFCFEKIALFDKIWVLQYCSKGTSQLDDGLRSPLFANVVAQHLTSAGGVRWHARQARSGGSSVAASLAPLHLRVGKGVGGEVPLHAAMVPDVLYTYTHRPSPGDASSPPFCDLVYLGPDGQVVCVHVSLERSGQRQRHVGVGAWAEFSERMGWGPSPSADQLRLITYVYCPEPQLASEAHVVFEGGVGLDTYTVWHVHEEFFSGV